MRIPGKVIQRITGKNNVVGRWRIGALGHWWNARGLEHWSAGPFLARWSRTLLAGVVVWEICNLILSGFVGENS